MSDYESILKGTHWKTQMDEQDAANLAASKQDVSDAVSKVFITIDRIGRRIHSGFGPDEAVEANQAVTTFLTQLNDMLVGNGEQITANFFSPTMASVNQTQVHELENRAERAEQELQDVRGNQDDLRRSAQRASNLQIELDECQREQRRLQSEADTLTTENGQLRSELEAEKANHQEAVNALRSATSEKDEAVESERAWESRANSLQQQLRGANTRITELEQQNDRGTEEPHGSADTEAGSQPARQPYPGGGIGDEDVTDPLIGGPNGTFAGTTPPAEVSADEPQPRSRPQRRERRSRRERPTNPDQNS